MNIAIAHYHFKKGDYKVEIPLPSLPEKRHNDLYAYDPYYKAEQLHIGQMNKRLDANTVYKLPKEAFDCKLTPGQDNVDFHPNEKYRIIIPDRDCYVDITPKQ